MSKKKGKKGNRYGGKTTMGGLYTPMTEIEQEALHRLVDNQNLVVHVLGWGRVDSPRVVVGDLRLGLSFRMDFTAPAAPTPVHFFDMELRTRSGILLYKERQATILDGKPVTVAAGLYLDMVWDIAITAIDPKLVKHIMPNAIGLTSRFQDKDTGDITMFGNQKMNAAERRDLLNLRQQEARSRQDTARQVKKAEDMADKAGIKLDPTKMGTGKEPG